MTSLTEELVARVKNHRCYTHPIFTDWARVNPTAPVVGALFHQIQTFCASTRPGWNFPGSLTALGMPDQAALMQEIVESESGHGPELATMAGHIVNQAAGHAICDDIYDQPAVEATLKNFSDEILGSLPGYEAETGLSVQARKAIAVFERRKQTDAVSTYRNLGTALALEMISNRQLIPGEKHCLVDSGLYGVDLEDQPMHYLLEHWGEIGAEQQHEQNAIEAITAVADERTEAEIIEGADDFLNSLAGLWDLLHSSLLQSGNALPRAA